MPSLATVCERDAAVADLERDFHAASSRKATEMKLRTIKTAISKWGLALYPPTAASIKALAATLKRGGYRSAESYLLLCCIEENATVEVCLTPLIWSASIGIVYGHVFEALVVQSRL